MTAMVIEVVPSPVPDSKRASVTDLTLKSKQKPEQAKTEEKQELAFQMVGLEWSGINLDKKIRIVKKTHRHRDRSLYPSGNQNYSNWG